MDALGRHRPVGQAAESRRSARLHCHRADPRSRLGRRGGGDSNSTPGPFAMTPFRAPQLSLQSLFLLFGLNGACCAAPEAPLKVDYAGCQAVSMPGRICVLGPTRTLKLWVEAPPDSIEVWVDGDRSDAAAEPIQDGQRFSIKVPD